jgi:uncharacterized metal-binding protein (TIGR02443 family)
VLASVGKTFKEMEITVNRRRFIAGAVCPRCAAMDKIVVDPDTDKRECVACGFSEARPGGGESATELPTRVSRAAARRVETATEVLTLIDPSITREED